MKYFKIIVLVFVSAVFLNSCKDTSEAPKQGASKSTQALDVKMPTKAATTQPISADPGQNALGVWHYTCIKGCPGGAGTTGKCNNCGSLLAHNPAYHGSANMNSAPVSSAPFANPPAAASTAPAGQNSAGVWHYTCSKGCAGGSGVVEPCASCGETLVHNVAFHQ